MQVDARVACVRRWPTSKADIVAQAPASDAPAVLLYRIFVLTRVLECAHDGRTTARCDTRTDGRGQDKKMQQNQPIDHGGLF